MRFGVHYLCLATYAGEYGDSVSGVGSVKLGEGELTMHFRRESWKRIECGMRSGCVTAVRADVTCENCAAIADLAADLALTCGCRRADVHTGVARAMHEMTDHQ